MYKIMVKKKYIYTVAATMTQVHFAHVMAHAFLPAGPCRGPSEATNRRLQAETRAGPHVTCAKKSQNNGFLRFIFAAKNSNNGKKTCKGRAKIEDD